LKSGENTACQSPKLKKLLKV